MREIQEENDNLTNITKEKYSVLVLCCLLGTGSRVVKNLVEQYQDLGVRVLRRMASVESW